MDVTHKLYSSIENQQGSKEKNGTPRKKRLLSSFILDTMSKGQCFMDIHSSINQDDHTKKSCSLTHTPAGVLRDAKKKIAA